MESPTILGLLSWVFIKGPQKKTLHSGILQLKLFNLFQAFNSWGSSKRCEQKKNRRGLLLIFFLVLCLRATLRLSERLEKARNYFMTCQFVRFWHGVLIIFCRVFGVACCLSFIRNSYCTVTLAKQHQLQRYVWNTVIHLYFNPLSLISTCKFSILISSCKAREFTALGCPQ